MQILKREIIRQCTVVTIQIPSLDISNTQSVSRRVTATMRGQGQVVVDLGALRYFDLNGFAAILHWAAGREGLEVRLCSQSGRVQALFELLSANSFVQLCRSREDAMALFRRPGVPYVSSATEKIVPLDEHARRVALEP